MRIFASIILYCLSVACAAAQPAPPQAAIATAHPLATRAGMAILAEGGNAFDAAVAISAALAVVEPAGSGLGGGGFWLLHRASDSLEVMIDGRERAPLAAHRDMYLDARGQPVPVLSVDGPLAAAIPGMPAAIVHLAEQYGKLPLKLSLAPAIRYAREGFPMGPRMRRLLQFRAPAIRGSAAAAAIFLPGGRLPEPGYRLVQEDLAATLETIAEEGKAGFYQGAIARKLVAAVQQAGGIWSLEDLEQYQALERAPLRGQYRGIRVTSAAPPSSGGVVLLEALNLLAPFDLPEGAASKHLIVEAMRRAYHDRALYLGDPDYVTMPLKRLLSADHARILRATIEPTRVTPSSLFKSPLMAEPKGRDTTHFSVIDREGNRVAATLSINYPFGAGFMAAGTGVLLNDEMDDFSSHPGTPNVYGLVGGEANAIAGGKRMLSSMTPTFLEQDGRVAVLGTPGGSRIISMVLLAVLDFARGTGPESWVTLPRFHHQYLPDRIQYETGALSADERQALLKLGHRLVEIRRPYGNMQALLWDRQNNRVEAASDPRGEGLALVAD